jgi:hypothetical protein
MSRRPKSVRDVQYEDELYTVVEPEDDDERGNADDNNSDLIILESESGHRLQLDRFRYRRLKRQNELEEVDGGVRFYSCPTRGVPQAAQ